MGKEIEKKFLIKNDEWREGAKGTKYRQGYLSTVKERTVRVRTIDDRGFLTIKGVNVGAVRAEYEYEIPAKDADEMLTDLCEKPLIEKNRYKISYKNLVWEIDEFFGDNNGLIVAEVELTDEHQSMDLPSWIGEEVTGDPKYFNSNLIKHPYSKW
ncbi:MAG: CYTH domain-containing protein [Candidatus Eremiobacterota bacterium]